MTIASTVTATTVNVNGGQLNVSGNLNTTTANVYTVGGVSGQLNLNSSGQLNLAGGTLNVAGTLNLEKNATLTASTVAVQAGGVATANGAFGTTSTNLTLLVNGGGAMTLNGTLTSASSGTVVVQGDFDDEFWGDGRRTWWCSRTMSDQSRFPGKW